MSLNFPAGSEGLVYRADNDVRYVYENGAWRVISGAFTHNPGPNAPLDPELGDLWVDTTKCPPELMTYDDDCSGDGPEWKPGQYLSKVNDDTAAGEITFEKITTHETGIVITNGNIRGDKRANFGGGTTHSSAVAGVYVGDDNPTNNEGALRGFDFNVQRSAYSYTIVEVFRDGGFSNDATTTLNAYYVGFKSLGFNKSNVVNNTGFVAANNISRGSGINIGFLSDLPTTGPGTSYNFFAEGNAPNFLTGSTYIGGSTARNTFELWKSTLTEEQLETLQAGTLVAPANVSTPGDGEFARQWWYDQQSAEDQSAIDAGELDYPEHLAAATFTDTFALGDNTSIKLE